MGYKPMLAVIDVDEARMLARRDQPGDVERARDLLQRGLDRAEEVGVPRIDERLARAAALLPARDAGPAPAEPPAGPAHAVLAREGDVWRMDYEGRTLRVRDAKGMRHLALLLANPGIEFHAVDVATAGRGRRGARGAERRRAGRAGAARGDAGPALDSQAKAEYRAAWRTCGPRSRRPRPSTTPSASPTRARRWSSSPTSCRPPSAWAAATAAWPPRPSAPA